jgi:hypothetical protein
MSPRLVRTRRIRPDSTSTPVTSVLADTVSAPSLVPSSRISVPAWRESTTPTVGLWKPPRTMSSLMKGMRSFTSAGEMSAAGSPHDLADATRRLSSSTRSLVRATSIPPLSVQTPSSLYWRIASCVNFVISFEWSTGKRKFEA